MSATFYEQSADAHNYIYFQDFPDMQAMQYRFMGLHIHKSLEIVVVYKGCMRCTVNNRTEDVSAGSICIVNSYDTHHFEYVENAAAYIMVISNEYLLDILDEKTEFNNFLHPNAHTMSELMKLLTNAYEQFDNYNLLQKRGLVNSMMGLLQSSNLLRKIEKNSNKEFFIKVSEYISNHYGEDLRLPKLAKIFGYSENYFSALFNKTAGVNLNEYVNGVRIQKVLELRKPLEKKYTLKEIVLRCGFNSMETYYRVLKKYNAEHHKADYKPIRNNFIAKERVDEDVKTPKKLWAAVVGYGNRGQVYADYSLDYPEELGIAAIIDPNEFKLSEAKKRYNLKDEQLFKSLDEFLTKRPDCDIVINATMDALHYVTAMKILAAKYNMLIEKPIVPNEKELLDIKNIAVKNGCQVFVCHVLRYAPYYCRIKELISQGAIGEIVTMEMNEHVCIAHYLTAYVRGKWNNEKDCGSGFLLAKSCHDLDLVCWLNNQTEPTQVASFGTRSQFIPKKKPKEAADYCYQCSLERECQYSSLKLHMEMNAMPFLTWDRLNKPLDEISDEEKLEFLKKDIYGRCAYDALGDLVDRQNIAISFENGSTCTFTLVGGAITAGRYLHIVGTQGEIEGKLDEDKFILRKYIDGSFSGSSEIINVKDKIISNAKFGGHNGGDYAIMHDVLSHLNGYNSSISLTKIEDSINGHLCVYAAEKSRKEGRIIELETIKNKQI